MGKKYKSDDADESAETTLGTDTPAEVAAPQAQSGHVLVHSHVVHQREWFGRIYGKKPTKLKISELQPGELDKLKSDSFLTVEHV